MAGYKEMVFSRHNKVISCTHELKAAWENTQDLNKLKLNKNLSMKSCRKHNSEQALEEPELIIMRVCFLHCQDAAWSSGTPDSKWSNKLVVLRNSTTRQAEFPPNPENCLDSNPGLCLSVNRTHPYERGSVCFVSSNNRIPPYAYYKSVLPRPVQSTVSQAVELMLMIKVSGTLL